MTAVAAIVKEMRFRDPVDALAQDAVRQGARSALIGGRFAHDEDGVRGVVSHALPPRSP